MDEEDLVDAEEARKIHTSDAFAGLGLTEDDTVRANSSSLAGLFRVQGETMGTKLLKKMGWKDGQGIGPKVRRAARLDVGAPGDAKGTHLFAPENIIVVRLVKKTDRKGLGYEGATRLSALAPPSRTASGRRVGADSDDEDDDGSQFGGFRSGSFGRPKSTASKKTEKKGRSSGMGMGVLNDTGSDDEDPYDMGPRISFNRVIGGDKKKKKPTQKKVGDVDSSTGAAKSKFVFSKRPAALGKVSGNARVCHDGRPALAGFVLGREPDALTSDMNATSKFPPPTIPPGWTSSKQPKSRQASGSYVSTAEAAKASSLDPKSRAAVLGEGLLPGKSVFDFLSPAARDRIAAATGRSDLPEARSEVPAEYALSDAEKLKNLLQEVPTLDKATAVAAISRGARGGGPYQDDEAKRSRYRAYLEYHAGIASALPPKPAKLRNDDWLQEFHEFFNCARIFKPMSGLMASRFTTSSSANQPLASGSNGRRADGTTSLVSRPPPKPQDPAEEAAKMGMYGPLTRSVQDFFPTRLLCKRLGVKAPAIVQPDQDVDMDTGRSAGASAWSSSAGSKPSFSFSSSAGDFRALSTGSWAGQATPATATATANTAAAAAATVAPAAKPLEDAVVRADRNEALEGQRASEDVFRAVFGDSDDDDDNDD